MTLHRVYGASSQYENVYIWQDAVGTGKFIGMINGKNLDSTTKDYDFCVSAMPHTILLEHGNTLAWGSGSYVDIQIGGVTIAQGFVDRLGLDRLEVYRRDFVVDIYF